MGEFIRGSLKGTFSYVWNTRGNVKGSAWRRPTTPIRELPEGRGFF